jgi:hypothetical protein
VKPRAKRLLRNRRDTIELHRSINILQLHINIHFAKQELDAIPMCVQG